MKLEHIPEALIDGFLGFSLVPGKHGLEKP